MNSLYITYKINKSRKYYVDQNFRLKQLEIVFKLTLHWVGIGPINKQYKFIRQGLWSMGPEGVPEEIGPNIATTNILKNNRVK